MIAGALIWLLCLLGALWVLASSASVAAAAAAALLVVLPLLSWGCNWVSRRKLEASIRMPSGGGKGAVQQGAVLLRSRAWLPLCRVSCRVRLENELTGEKQTLRLHTVVPPRGTVTVPFSLCAAHCGRIRASLERVWLMDCFGLLPVPVHLQADGRTMVLPDLFDLSLFLQIPALSPDDSERYDPVRRGNDLSEVLQVRDYQPGDSLRQIHWKLSGKLDKLVLRDPSLPVARSLLVFWDKSAGGQVAPQVMDALAEAAASLCQALTMQGIAFTLGWNDGNSQQCECYEIPDNDTLCQYIPHMLKTGCGSSAQSGAGCYLQTRGIPAYSRILYLSAGVPAELEEFGGAGRMSVLLCSETAPELPFETVVFTADNGLQTLQTVELNG